METIPKISFLKSASTNIEFEIFSLQSLFERAIEVAPAITVPHRVQFYILIYIEKGEGIHEIDLFPHEYRPGSLILISKGQVQRFVPCKQVQGFMVLFTDDFITKNLAHADTLSFFQLYNYQLLESMVHLDEQARPLFSGLIQQMLVEQAEPELFAKEEILRLLLIQFLLRVARNRHLGMPTFKNAARLKTFLEFYQLLEENFNHTRKADEYASFMNISYKHLNKICQNVTGKTIKSVIDQFVVLEAKRRLALTDFSIQELAYELGFDEPTNFVKFFKKHVQRTPSQFKKELQFKL